MPRGRYEGVELTEALRPVARPVDTFIQPARKAPDDTLTELARGLQGLGGALGATLGRRDADQEEADRLQGEAAFHQNNSEGFAEGVSSGRIPAQYSKSFMEGYKRAQGSNLGDQLQAKFQAAYDVWDGKGSTDPKAFDGFVSSFMKENLNGQSDPAILKGLLPSIRQIVNNGQSAHIADVSKAVQADAIKQSLAQQNRTLDNGNAETLATGKPFDADKVFGEMEAIRAQALKVGQNPEKYDKELIDGVIQASVEKPEANILRFFERKVPGKDYTWGETPYGREQLLKAKDTIATAQRKEVAEGDRRRREEKSAAKDDITRQTIEYLNANPGAPVPEELIKKGTLVDPNFRVDVLRWKDTLDKGGVTSNPADLRKLTEDMINDPSGAMARVQRGIVDGTFKNKEDLTAAYNLAKGMKEDGGKIDAILKGSSAKVVLDTIKKRTASDKDLGALFDDGSVSDEGLQAQQDFKIQALQWMQANPKAGPVETEKAIGQIGADILSRIGQQDEGTGKVTLDRKGMPDAGTYPSRPPGQTPPAEATPAPTPKPPGPLSRTTDTTGASPSTGLDGREEPVLPAATPPAAPPAQPGVGPQAKDATAWFQGLPEDRKAIVESAGKAMGLGLGQAIEHAYGAGIKRGLIKPANPGQQSMRAPDGTPIATASVEQTGSIANATRTAITDAVDAEPAPDVKERTTRMLTEAFTRALGSKDGATQGNYQLATLKNDPHAARILDFVAGPESGGNYNAYFGHGNSKMDLSKMSMDQIIAWSGNRGTKSSATGRYQFMKKTLIDLKGELGMTGREMFTPELQDKLAVALLERRGYSDYKAGKVSASTFANNLAKEWASLPLVKDEVVQGKLQRAGGSAYAGDGLNKSLVSTASVMAAIGKPGPATPPVSTASNTNVPDQGRLRSFFNRLLGRNV